MNSLPVSQRIHPFRRIAAAAAPLCSALLLLASPGPAFAQPAPAFVAARPVWAANREMEKNLTLGFHARVPAPRDGARVVLRLAASCLYRVSVNNQFAGHGPARGPHGFYRVDEWDLTPLLAAGDNAVAIEVAGYNANSYYLLEQPSFLQAEVLAEGRVLAATGSADHPLAGQPLTERVQKTQRYSFQRPFTEIWRLAPGWDAWRTNGFSPAPAPLAIQPAKALLPRRIPCPNFSRRQPATLVSTGRLKSGIKVEQPWKDRSLTGVGPQLGGYPEAELAAIPSLELQGLAHTTNVPSGQPYAGDPLALEAGGFAILDLGLNLTGFLQARVRCQTPARFIITFDEILSGDDVDFKRLGCVNAVVWELQPGTYDLESFEPYTQRYLKLIALEGACEVSAAGLREYANDSVWGARFAASDERLNRLFAAGRETFRQNAVDIFMDCPSRERAGWLCDSFFTARVARDLCGDNRIEKNFLENFALPPSFAHLPDGMLPMCYPADHHDGVFIPNWALWFVVELEEYAARSGDRELVEALRPRVLRLFEYFKRFRNSDGLLEKLESWVFVEWSKANDFVQDVNYPSNMLFARALAAAGRLYRLPELAQDAAKIQATIRQQSYDGEFFVDNAVRKDGKLTVTRHRSEVCQYFAFFFGIATPESHPKLWQTLVKDFGPTRRQTKAFPEVHQANAFIGNVLRLELLSQHGLDQQNLDESLAYNLYMADRTGTLWEHDGTYASCNHGFASHAVHVLYRDVLGLAKVDTVDRQVTVRFNNLRLDWCDGRMPVPGGWIELRWRKQEGKLLYKTSVPAGYKLAVENRSGLVPVPEP